MKSGSFEAYALELGRLRDWRRLLGLAGLFQFPVYLLLADSYVLPRSEFAVETSIVVLLGSIPLLLALRLTQGKPGRIVVKWKDTRDALGTLEISYVNPRGRRRTGLIIERLEPRPADPLYRAGWSKYQPVIPVADTNASHIIVFRNLRKFTLGLGFHYADEMNEVYEQLKVVPAEEQCVVCNEATFVNS